MGCCELYFPVNDNVYLKLHKNNMSLYNFGNEQALDNTFVNFGEEAYIK